jgi:hypothetical protein
VRYASLFSSPFVCPAGKPMLQIRLWRNIPTSPLFRRRAKHAWAGENYAFFRFVTLKIVPTFIPYKFQISDFGFWI